MRWLVSGASMVVAARPPITTRVVVARFWPMRTMFGWTLRLIVAGLTMKTFGVFRGVAAVG